MREEGEHGGVGGEGGEKADGERRAHSHPVALARRRGDVPAIPPAAIPPAAIDRPATVSRTVGHQDAAEHGGPSSDSRSTVSAAVHEKSLAPAGRPVIGW